MRKAQLPNATVARSKACLKFSDVRLAVRVTLEDGTRPVGLHGQSLLLSPTPGTAVPVK